MLLNASSPSSGVKYSCETATTSTISTKTLSPPSTVTSAAPSWTWRAALPRRQTGRDRGGGLHNDTVALEDVAEERLADRLALLLGRRRRRRRAAAGRVGARLAPLPVQHRVPVCRAERALDLAARTRLVRGAPQR